MKFECKNCKHLSKRKCWCCGKKRSDYKKSHPQIREQLLYLYGTFLAMVVYKMKTTGVPELDEQIFSIWGKPWEQETSTLEPLSSLAK